MATCGSAVSCLQFSGVYLQKDAVRFVGTVLTSPPIVINGINGITQGCGTPGGNSRCATAALYSDPTASNGTAIPQVLDPTVFNSGPGGCRSAHPAS